MINPNRLHRAKAKVLSINGSHCGQCHFDVKGRSLFGYFDNPKFKVGDIVNVQCQFSIVSDTYIVMTANKPRKPKASK